MTDTGWTENATSETNSNMFMLSHVLQGPSMNTDVNRDLHNELEAWRVLCKQVDPLGCAARTSTLSAVLEWL